MPLFRRILFWTHLAAGLIAGLFIGIMFFTGATLAFEDVANALFEEAEANDSD